MRKHCLEILTTIFPKLLVLWVMIMPFILAAPSKKEKGCPLPSIVKVFLNKKGNGYRWTAATLIIVPLLQVLSSSFFLLASNFAFLVIYSSQETKKGEQRYEKQITSFYRKYFKILCRFIGPRLLSPRLLSPLTFTHHYSNFSFQSLCSVGKIPMIKPTQR